MTVSSMKLDMKCPLTPGLGRGETCLGKYLQYFQDHPMRQGSIVGPQHVWTAQTYTLWSLVMNIKPGESVAHFVTEREGGVQAISWGPMRSKTMSLSPYPCTSTDHVQTPRGKQETNGEVIAPVTSSPQLSHPNGLVERASVTQTPVSSFLL